MSAAHACAAGPEADPSSCLLCQGAASARPQPAGPMLPIPPLQWHCQHLPVPIGPGAEPAPSCSAHSTQRSQPPGPHASQTREAASETLLPALLSTCLGPAHEAGTQGGSCGSVATSWDRFPLQASSETCPSEAQACSSCGLLCKSPHAGVHEPQETVLLASLLPAHGVPQQQERELRQVAGTSHHTHSMGGSWQG